jgi:hypothetical protein
MHGKAIILAGALIFGMTTAAFAQNASGGQPSGTTVTGSPTGATGGNASAHQPTTKHKALKHRPRAVHTEKSSG